MMLRFGSASSWSPTDDLTLNPGIISDEHHGEAGEAG
jgi:hypothetical protein